MDRTYGWILKHKELIILIFAIAAIVSIFLKSQVKVNYDINDYLPEASPSTKAANLMEKEFVGVIPNARVMIPNLSVVEALEYKEKLSNIDGVIDVLWLDDTMDLKEPLAIQDIDTVETYYKDEAALYDVIIDENNSVGAVDLISKLIGDDGAMMGSEVDTAVATETTVDEIYKIAIIAVPIVFLILLITTYSWFEPVIILLTIGVAILLNVGSNIFSGTIL